MPAIIAAFFQGDVLRALAEVQARGGLHAVRAVPENHLIAVQREDLAFRVALFDLNGDENLFDLPLRALVAERETDLVGKQIARSCIVSVLAPATMRRRRRSLLSRTSMADTLSPK
jgi:hypothetical protein